MTDEEFVALEPPAALAAVNQIATETERTRLRQLYARTRGMLVDGTGSRGARAFDPASMRLARAALAPASRFAVDASGMLGGGRILFALGCLLVVVGVLSALGARQNLNGIGDFLGAGLELYGGSSLLGIGAFMWMLGALEQRLIEIRGLLEDRPQR